MNIEGLTKKWHAKNTPPNKLVYVTSANRVSWRPAHLMNVDQLPTDIVVTICGARFVGAVPLAKVDQDSPAGCRSCFELARRYDLFTKP